MSGGFRGVDPVTAGASAVRLDWPANDLDRRTDIAAERLARHTRWSSADTVGIHLSTASHWGDDRLDDARDWTGDRMDDLVDVGTGLIGTGADVFDFTTSILSR